MTTYIFNIEKRDNGHKISDIIKYVRKFYRFDTKPAPICIFSQDKNKILVTLTSVAKKNLAVVEDAHKKLTSRKLSRPGFVLSYPEKFEKDVCSWWTSDINLRPGEKWATLEHNGPYFSNLMEPYKPSGLSIWYKIPGSTGRGQKIKLTSDEEEVLMLYATILFRDKQGTSAVAFSKDAVFNRNFNNDMKKYISSTHKNIIKDVQKINFKELLVKVDNSRAANRTEKEKYQLKCLNKAKKMKYGYAKINDFLEEVGNYTVEPMGIFQGRGKQPNRGKIKPKIIPEDVTINIGENAQIPTPPKGHKWGKIVHDHSAEWIAKWRDVIMKAPKYTRFSAKGQFKGKNDYTKFEVVRQLNNDIGKIREKYEKDLKNTSTPVRQLATVLYLIDHFGIRPGGASSQEVGVVGASTLMVQNVKPTEGKLHLDFLGKDSVRYKRDLYVSPEVSANITLFQKGKNPGSQLFNISADDVNKYIQTINPLYSAKKFRTRLASSLMEAELKKIKVPKNATDDKKKFLLDQANVQVALALNHMKTVSKAHSTMMSKIRDKIKKYKTELVDLRDQPQTSTMKNRIKKKKEMLQKEQNNLKLRNKTKNIAPGTSRTNYIDPRILLSWALKHNLPIEKVYSKTLREKFEWAKCLASKDWNYENTPINEEIIKSAKAEKAKLTIKTRERIRKTRMGKGYARRRILPSSFKKKKREYIPKKQRDDENLRVKYGPESPVIIVLNYTMRTHALFGDFGGVYKRFKDDFMQPFPYLSYNPNLVFGAGWILTQKDRLSSVIGALKKYDIPFLKVPRNVYADEIRITKGLKKPEVLPPKKILKKKSPRPDFEEYKPGIYIPSHVNKVEIIPGIHSSQNDIKEYISRCFNKHHIDASEKDIQKAWNYYGEREDIILQKLEETRLQLYDSIAPGDQRKAQTFQRAIAAIRMANFPIISGEHAKGLPGIGRGIAYHIDKIVDDIPSFTEDDE